jgi:hypothetical protein
VVDLGGSLACKESGAGSAFPAANAKAIFEARMKLSEAEAKSFEQDRRFLPGELG